MFRLRRLLKMKLNHKDIIRLTLANLKTTNNSIYQEVKDKQPKFLERGSYAYAYKLGNYCFKITSDVEDAIMSSKVRDRNDLKHIVKIYDVFLVKEKTVDFGKYVIISELLEKIPSKFSYMEGYHSIFCTTLKNQLRDFVINGVTDKKISMFREKLQHLMSPWKEEWREQIVTLCLELAELNFSNVDGHNQNYMYCPKTDCLKLVDLGYLTSDLTELEEEFKII